MLSSSLASSSPLLVIGSGSTVVTWDCRHEEPNLVASADANSEENSSLKSFTPFASSSNDGGGGAPPKIADLAWNHNGQVLACCSTATSLSEDYLRKNICLMSSHSGSMLDSFRHTDSSSADASKNSSNAHAKLFRNNNLQGGPAATCVAFGGKSRYLCIGDQQGDVCLWDLKKQSRVRQFKSKKRQLACLQACLDPTATYVCALSAETFTLYHLRQATFAKQWNFNSVKGGWNQFRFSPLQPTLMALGDNIGRIQLHDGLEQEQPQLVCGGGHTSHASTTTSLLPHHASPITGLAFSTQNSKLLANVRANGILEFVDTSTGEVIHHQPTGGNAASALAFQGVSCVVGTETGEVQVYDLRKMMQQFGKAVTTARVGEAITTLEFAPMPKPPSASTSTTATTSASARTRTRSTSPPSRRPSASAGGGATLGNAISFDLESRASMTSYQEPPLLPNASSLTNADFVVSTSTTNTTATTTTGAPRDNASDERSKPLESTSSLTTAPKEAPPARMSYSNTAANTTTSTRTNSDHDIIHPSNSAQSSTAATHGSNSIQRVATGASINSSSGVLGSPIRSSNANVVLASPSRVPPMGAATTNAPTASRAPHPHLATRSTSFSTASTAGMGNNNYNTNNANSHARDQPTSSSAYAPSKPSSTNTTTSNNTNVKPRVGPSPEMAAFLQTMVRQEMQHHMSLMQDEVETCIRNLHVDMIRQFHRQSQEMTSLLRKQQSQMDQLLQENEFLREQNAALQQERQPGGGNNKNGYH